MFKTHVCAKNFQSFVASKKRETFRTNSFELESLTKRLSASLSWRLVCRFTPLTRNRLEDFTSVRYIWQAIEKVLIIWSSFSSSILISHHYNYLPKGNEDRSLLSGQKSSELLNVRRNLKSVERALDSHHTLKPHMLVFLLSLWPVGGFKSDRSARLSQFNQ